MECPKLGRLDFCIDVENIQSSFEFYSKLGMKQVEGNIAENWVVLAHRNLRLGLYQGMFKGFSLNFRGGDVGEISKYLATKNANFKQEYTAAEKGGGTAIVLDPDGYPLFFDTHYTELTIQENMDQYLQDVKSEAIGIGDAEICLNVKDIHKSHKFYSDLGFGEIKGNVDSGWVTLENSNLILKLIKSETNDLSIDFRGADVDQIDHDLKSKGIGFKHSKEGDGITFEDPDGYSISINP